MKNIQSLKTAKTVILSWLLLNTVMVFSQEKVTLTYKFQEGETVKYRTERMDSTSMDMGGQKNSMNVTTWSVNSLTIQKTLPDHFYEIESQQDTSWNNADQSGFTAMGGSSGGGSGGTVRRSAPGSSKKAIKMNNLGRDEERKPISSPYIIPLPEKPIQVNESWAFNYTTEQTGRATGQTDVTGTCLLYAVTEKQDARIATIILNSETTSRTEIKIKMNDQEISMKSASKSSGMSLVYFNINTGRVIEIISESSREMTTESPMGGGGLTTVNSKTTITLQ